jgi:hypothetical protein
VTRAGLFLRRSVERFFNRWHEGPQPPKRLLVIVEDFAEEHPAATRAEWARFATEHAAEAYRSGFVRGVEHVERDPDPFPYPKPEQVADDIFPGWRESEPVILFPNESVNDEEP